jgi:hypothetical protein
MGEMDGPSPLITIKQIGAISREKIEDIRIYVGER